MRTGMVKCLAMAALAVLVAVSAAQPPKAVTTRITLTELHCNGCLKKITKHLVAVSGVSEVQGHLPSATVTVTHRPGMSPSPRAMWEAVENADHTPTRLEGPSGAFVEKPRR